MTAVRRSSTDRSAGTTVDVWIARLRDPGISAGVVLVSACVAGFVALALAWRGANANATFVPQQLPFVVSGGLGGVGLIGAAGALLATHADRRRMAARRAAIEGICRSAAELVELVEVRRGAPGSVADTPATGAVTDSPKAPQRQRPRRPTSSLRPGP